LGGFGKKEGEGIKNLQEEIRPRSFKRNKVLVFHAWAGGAAQGKRELLGKKMGRAGVEERHEKMGAIETLG